MSLNNAVYLAIPVVTLISIAATYFYYWKTQPTTGRKFFRKYMSAVVKWGLVSTELSAFCNSIPIDSMGEDCKNMRDSVYGGLTDEGQACNEFSNSNFRRWRSLAIRSSSCSGVASVLKSMETSRIYTRTSVQEPLRDKTTVLKMKNELCEVEHPLWKNEEVRIMPVSSVVTTFKGDAVGFDCINNLLRTKGVERDMKSLQPLEKPLEGTVIFVKGDNNVKTASSHEEHIPSAKFIAHIDTELSTNSKYSDNATSDEENQSPLYHSLRSTSKMYTPGTSNNDIRTSERRDNIPRNSESNLGPMQSFKSPATRKRSGHSIDVCSYLKVTFGAIENRDNCSDAHEKFVGNSSSECQNPSAQKIESSLHRLSFENKPTTAFAEAASGVVGLYHPNWAQGVPPSHSHSQTATTFASIHQDTEVVGEKNKHHQRFGSLDLIDDCPAKRETGDDCKNHELPIDVKVEKAKRECHQMLELFQYVRLIAKGSFGKVALTMHAKTRKYVAVKFMRKIERLMGCIRRERMVFSVINSSDHPFLVHLWAAFQIKTHVFFAMEFIPGRDLTYHVQMTPTWDLQVQAIFYSACVILALEFLHSHHIIHRDLKLQNILMCEDGYVKLADYGLSRKLEPGEYAHSVCGTLTHMAPEILNKEMYTRATDWWALGIVLYEMMVKKCPFYGKEKKEVLDLIYRNCLTFPRYMKADAIEIVRKLLRRNPKERLGYVTRNDEEIKDHPFYKDIDWERLYKKQLKAPYLPTLQTEQHHEGYIPQEWPSFTEDDQSGKTLEIHIQDFSYVANSSDSNSQR